ncbi:MAG: ShlB/FhaC/HecB family hemolysin secretion/activation protein [Achromobacter mucicolens]
MSGSQHFHGAWLIWVALCAGAGIGSAWAQPAPEAAQRATEIQRRQEQEIDAQRARAAERPDVLSAPSAAQPGGLTLPPETPCFVLREVIWEGAEPPDLLARATAIVLGECVGGRGLRALQEHLIGLLIDDGLVTARVVVPEQSLADGSLTLRYLPGRISAVQSQDGIGWWRTALPTGPGGELNQRDLDQALENIRRLGSQADAAIDIAPGPELGDSDILIKPGTDKRWHGYLGGDNGGMDTVGKYQINAGLTLDSPLFLYDQLSVSWNSNAHWRDADSHTRAASINYNVPFGYWTVFAGASKSTYRQTVAGFEEPIVYGGTTKQIQAGVSVVPYRGTSYKGNLSLTVLRKRTDSTLNDVAIDVQHRDVTGYEIGYGHRHYVGRAVLDIGGGVRGTLPQFSDEPGYIYGDPDWNGRSTILTANAGAYLPFQVAGQTLAYQANWQIQHAKTAIVPADYFTIGNRYAVRGFDGQMTLAAEDGWTLRNDLSFNLDELTGLAGQQLYTGLDVGRVGGPSAEYLSGRTLVGAVAGLRGRLSIPHVSASYDLSAGWPLKKPESLKTASTVFAMAVMLEF